MYRFVCFLMFLSIALALQGTAMAQSGGWQDNGRYKYMQIQKFWQLHLSKNGSRMYTLGDDNYVRYYDTESGNLIDSLLFDFHFDHINFSSDGTSIITCSDRHFDRSNKDSIIVINLDSKKIAIPINDSIYQNLWFDCDRKIDYIDYYEDSKIFTAFYDLSNSGGHPFTWVVDGGQKIFKINDSTKNNSYDYYDIGQLDRIWYTNGSLFMTANFSIHDEYGNRRSHYGGFIYDFVSNSIKEMTPDPAKQYYYLNYSKYYDCYLLSDNNILYYVNPKNNKIYKEKNIEKMYSNPFLTENGKCFVYYINDSDLVISDVNSLNNIDTIRIPIFIDYYYIHPNNNQIICFESSTGKVFKYNSKFNTDSVGFILSSSVAHSSDTVSFSSYGNISAKSYTWFINGSKVSEKEYFDYTFKQLGVYNIQLEITDQIDIKHKIEKKNCIKIIPDLKASFTAEKSTGRIPFIVDFKNTSTGILGLVTWYFGDGDSSNIVNPEHIYTQPGNYAVKLIVNDEISSDTLSIKKFINAIEPDVDFVDGILKNKLLGRAGQYAGYLFDYWFVSLYAYTDYHKYAYFFYKSSVWAGNDESDKYLTGVTDCNLFCLNDDSIKHATFFLSKYYLYSNFYTDLIKPIFVSYNNTLLFDHFPDQYYFKYNLSDTNSITKIFPSPIYGSWCNSASFDGTDLLLLYDDVVYFANFDTVNKYLSISPKIPYQRTSIGIANNGPDRFLYYYKTKASDSSYFLASMGPDTLEFNQKIFDMKYNLAEHFYQIKSSNMLVICGKRTIDSNDFGFITLLDNKGNIIIDTVISTCREISYMHEMPDGNLLFSNVGLVANAYIFNPLNMRISHRYVLNYDSNNIEFHDVVPINENTLLFYGHQVKTETGWNQSVYIIKAEVGKSIFSWPSEIGDKIELSNISISPNPASEFIYLNKGLQALVPGEQIKIYNTLGECVITLETGLRPVSTKIDVSALPAGVYFCRMHAGGEILTSKFVVVR